MTTYALPALPVKVGSSSFTSAMQKTVTNFNSSPLQFKNAKTHPKTLLLVLQRHYLYYSLPWTANPRANASVPCLSNCFLVINVISTQIMGFDLTITIIRTQAMQNQPYMLFLTTASPTFLPLPPYTAFGTFISTHPFEPSSTSTQFTSSTPLPAAVYPLAYNSLCLPFSYSQFPEIPSSPQSVQNIQTDQLAGTLLGSSSTTPLPLPQPPLSECSIKMEESAIPDAPISGCKKRSSSTQVRKCPVRTDREYNPSRPQRHVVRKRLHQNQNRNVVPNEINQILSFIQKQSKSGHLVARLLAKFPGGQGYNIKRFYLYQGLLRQRVSHYTNERSLRLIAQLYEPEGRIWPLDEQHYYNQLCRLLVRHFLLEDSVFIILTSKRMKSQKKIDHLRARRKVAQRVLEILRGG